MKAAFAIGFFGAQVLAVGCPADLAGLRSVAVERFFNVDKITGTWYENAY